MRWSGYDTATGGPVLVEKSIPVNCFVLVSALSGVILQAFDQLRRQVYFLCSCWKKNETGPPRLSKRLRSLRKNPISRASLKYPTTPTSNASPPSEEDDDRKSGGLPTGQKPEASSAARTGPSTAHQPAHNSNGDHSTEAGSDCKAAIPVSVPIAGLWILVYEQLMGKSKPSSSRSMRRRYLCTFLQWSAQQWLYRSWAKCREESKWRYMWSKRWRKMRMGNGEYLLDKTTLLLVTWLDILLFGRGFY